MVYHIYTGLIIDKVNENTDCPLCAIKKVVEEEFLYEFLNDAVMDDDVRTKVNKLGFCSEHFDKLLDRKNKLSVALQISTRLNTIINDIKSPNFKHQTKKLEEAESTCVICDLVKESMEKYYKTFAYMFLTDKNFAKSISKSKGFCLEHYKELLKYSSHAGAMKKEYLKVLQEIELNNLYALQSDLKTFCDKHDYRNRNMPLGSAEKALPKARTKLYGEK